MIERENREKPLGLTPSPQGSHLQEKGAVRAREALPLMEKKKYYYTGVDHILLNQDCIYG